MKERYHQSEIPCCNKNPDEEWLLEFNPKSGWPWHAETMEQRIRRPEQSNKEWKIIFRGTCDEELMVQDAIQAYCSIIKKIGPGDKYVHP